MSRKKWFFLIGGSVLLFVLIIAAICKYREMDRLNRAVLEEVNQKFLLRPTSAATAEDKADGAKRETPPKKQVKQTDSLFSLYAKDKQGGQQELLKIRVLGQHFFPHFSESGVSLADTSREQPFSRREDFFHPEAGSDPQKERERLFGECPFVLFKLLIEKGEAYREENEGKLTVSFLTVCRAKGSEGELEELVRPFYYVQEKKAEPGPKYFHVKFRGKSSVEAELGYVLPKGSEKEELYLVLGVDDLAQVKALSTEKQ